MPDTTSKPEPSDLVKASPLMLGLFESGVIAPEEVERQALGAQRLKEAFSSMPFHTRRAAKDPEYWNDLYSSRITW